jgi:hypothetical protein
LSSERSTAYFTSLVVTGVPSSNFTPDRILYVHVFASSLGVPSDSARSGTSSTPLSPGAGVNIVRARPYRRMKFHE